MLDAGEVVQLGGIEQAALGGGGDNWLPPPSAWLELLLPLLADYFLSPLITMISCLLSIFVVLGNLLVVTAIWHENQLHTVTNYLIASLAAADCLVGALVMPFNIISEIIVGSWSFGATWCDLWHSFDVLASTASIMNLCAISLDRYLAITNPISYPTKMTPKRVAFLIVSIWTCSSLISFPAIAWWRAVGPGPLEEIIITTNTPPPSRLLSGRLSNESHGLNNDMVLQQQPTIKQYKCVFTDDTYYLLFSSFISFYGPLCVMLYAYYCIYRAAVQQTRFLKYGSKQVMVGGKRPRYLSELSTGGGGNCGNGGKHGDKWSTSGDRDADTNNLSNGFGGGGGGGGGANGEAGSQHHHDRQRLVLRVHRGGGASSTNSQNLNTATNLSNSSYKSTSSATNASNAVQFKQRNQGSCKFESPTTTIGHKRLLVANGTKFSYVTPGSFGTATQALNGLRGAHYSISRRDELRVRSQRFDSTSCSTPIVAAIIPETASGIVNVPKSHLNATHLMTQNANSLPLVGSSSAAGHKKLMNLEGARGRRLKQHQSMLTTSESSQSSRSSLSSRSSSRSSGSAASSSSQSASSSSSSSRNSIVTVEPRGIADVRNERRNSTTTTTTITKTDHIDGKRGPLRSKSKSCRNVTSATTNLLDSSPGGGETDELLARTRDVLRKFKRTISLESALELKRKRKRAIQVTINLDLNKGGAAMTTTTFCDHLQGGGGGGDGSSSGGRQLAPAMATAATYQDSPDKQIRGIVDLSAIHYIDCAAGCAQPTSSTTQTIKTQSTQLQKAEGKTPQSKDVAPGQLGPPPSPSPSPLTAQRTPTVLMSSGTSLAASVINAPPPPQPLKSPLPSRKHKKLTSQSQSQSQSSGQSGGGAIHQANSSQSNGKKLTKLAKERKAAKTLGIVVGVFILCWLPFFVVNIIVATCGIHCIFKPHILISIVTWLGWLNSAMNPVIYACWSRDFRRAFRKTLCTWVEFVCYDGANMARKLKLKKGASYLNTHNHQEAFLSKSAPNATSFRHTTGACNTMRAFSSHRSAVSIEIEGASGSGSGGGGGGSALIKPALTNCNSSLSRLSSQNVSSDV